MQSLSRLRTLPPLVHHLRPGTRPSLLSINYFRLTPSHKAHESNMSLDEWKTRAPYRIHENTEDFKVRYEGSCHCGRVKYQLSRETPLAAKYCHCTTCQTLHGKIHQFLHHSSSFHDSGLDLLIFDFTVRSSFPMGGHLPQRRHQLHARPPRPGLVRQLRENNQAQAPLQSQLCVLSITHHGRGEEHDSAVPNFDPLQGE